MRGALATMLLVAAGACEPAKTEPPIDSFELAVEARAGTPFDSTAGPAVTLVMPESAPVGAKVPIKIRITNNGSAPLDLYLRGREAVFDISVTDSTGDAVWRRLEGEVTQAILQLKTLAAGEVFEVSGEWDQKAQTGTQVAPGTYGVMGTILTDGQRTLATEIGRLRIIPR